MMIVGQRMSRASGMIMPMVQYLRHMRNGRIWAKPLIRTLGASMIWSLNSVEAWGILRFEDVLVGYFPRL